ncbi:MAG: hypothetical protein OER90_08790 [Gemmatimonadota bacterium]|nr:hypothetical protein [Gemmatimonadota bacterium]
MYGRAEALLVAGQLKEARSLLEQHLRGRRDDARALTLLGRVYLEWPVVGRWRALGLLRDAAAAAPQDPDPWYWRIHVGKFLGSADGEALMRSGIRGVLLRDPEYRDVWAFWDEVYHNPRHLLQIARLLERHAGHPKARLRRALLLTEAGEYEAAESQLASLVTAGHVNGTVFAVRAQAALEAGHIEQGLRHYEAALAQAASDSLGILWRQVAAIAWPYEDSLYAASRPAEREAFFRAFWARREPDLFTQANDRIIEHFARLRHAGARYRLLHPQSRFHYSVERRALMGSERQRVFEALLDLEAVSGILPGRSRFDAEIQAAGLGVDVRDIPEPDSLTRYRRYGFDGRGLIYLRFGEPARRLVDLAADVEAWDYDVAGARGRIVFARASAGSGGDMIFYPTGKAELHNTLVMLERDDTSLRADLDVQAWAAFFRGPEPGAELVYVGVNADTSAAAAWDTGWTEVQRVEGAAPHVLQLGPGPYQLGLDTRRGERRGRLRGEIAVPNHWRGRLTLSSLLIGVTADTAFDRDEVARNMPGDRRFPAGSPLAVYAEIYGLSVDRVRMSHFTVQYAFEPVDGRQLFSLSFERSVAGADVVRERVTVQPDRLPPGRYRLRLTVQDAVRRRIVQSTVVPFELY